MEKSKFLRKLRKKKIKPLIVDDENENDANNGIITNIMETDIQPEVPRITQSLNSNSNPKKRDPRDIINNHAKALSNNPQNQTKKRKST